MKIKNTKLSNSKIEPVVSPPTDQMPRKKSEKPEKTAEQHRTFSEQKKQIDDYKDQKKLQERYTTLRLNLESIRESRPVAVITTKQQNKINYYENMKVRMMNTLQGYERDKEHGMESIKHKIETCERTLEDLKKRMKEKEINYDDTIQSQRKRIQTNEDYLNKAKEEANQIKKNKEEIRVEKQIQQLLQDFKKTAPDRDLEFYFPGYKAYLPGAVQSIQNPPPPSDPNINPIIYPKKEEDDDDDDDDDESEEEKEETHEEKVARCKKSQNPWVEWILSNPALKDSLYDLYHTAIANGITPPIPEPANPKKPKEDEATLWSKMTSWEKFKKRNPELAPYEAYHTALTMGITPDIPEPPNPNPPKAATHANKTMSRQSLSKIIPGYK